MTLLIPAVSSGPLTLDAVHHVDLLALCAALPDRSIDLILADLPYGTTQNDWGRYIPFEPMWTAFKRIIKPRGAIVLTASQPFTSRLVCSNLDMFRYEWIWDKSIATGFFDAPRKPLKRHESVLVFSLGRAPYFPQMSKNGRPRTYKRVGSTTVYNSNTQRCQVTEYDETRYPTSLLDFPHQMIQNVHPNQKPIALFEYLIRTYTRPGEVVLDPVVGSGTTAIAARNTGRHYICGDCELKYVNVAKERLAVPYTPPLVFAADPPADGAAPVQTALGI